MPKFTGGARLKVILGSHYEPDGTNYLPEAIESVLGQDYPYMAKAGLRFALMPEHLANSRVFEPPQPSVWKDGTSRARKLRPALAAA
jgi:hypothetical protein